MENKEIHSDGIKLENQKPMDVKERNKSGLDAKISLPYKKAKIRQTLFDQLDIDNDDHRDVSMRESRHSILGKPLAENLAQFYCAVVSAACFGLCLGVGAVMYWEYDEIQTVTPTEYLYCMLVLMMIDISMSTFGPFVIARFGYGVMSMCLNSMRFSMLCLMTFYFTEDHRPPHVLFTFVCGSIVLCCPTFMLSATCIDAWLCAAHPEFRLIGNFVPVLVAGTMYSVSSFLCSWMTTFWSMVSFCIIAFNLTALEVFFNVYKGYFQPQIVVISFKEYVAKIMSFFTMELIVKAFAADGILATSWVIFLWYIPVYQAGSDYTIEEINKAGGYIGATAVTVGVGLFCGYMLWVSWGIKEEDLLLKKLMNHHVYCSWVSKIIFLAGLLYFWKWGLFVHIGVMGFSLGSSFATPNSMIMILSVPEDCAVAYSGFAQVSFVAIVYGVGLWMNYYGGSFSNENYSVGYGVIFGIISVMNLVPFTCWSYYENYSRSQERSFRSVWTKKQSTKINLKINVKTDALR